MECIFAHPSLSIFEWCDLKLLFIEGSKLLVDNHTYSVITARPVEPGGKGCEVNDNAPPPDFGKIRSRTRFIKNLVHIINWLPKPPQIFRPPPALFCFDRPETQKKKLDVNQNSLMFLCYKVFLIKSWGSLFFLTDVTHYWVLGLPQLFFNSEALPFTYQYVVMHRISWQTL